MKQLIIDNTIAALLILAGAYTLYLLWKSAKELRSDMERLKQVISNINVLEARLGQLEQLEIDQKRDYASAKEKIKQELEPLYKEKQLLLTTVDVAEPQYMV